MMDIELNLDLRKYGLDDGLDSATVVDRGDPWEREAELLVAAPQTLQCLCKLGAGHRLAEHLWHIGEQAHCWSHTHLPRAISGSPR